jgi:hypothetical protein
VHAAPQIDHLLDLGLEIFAPSFGLGGILSQRVGLLDPVVQVLCRRQHLLRRSRLRISQRCRQMAGRAAHRLCAGIARLLRRRQDGRGLVPHCGQRDLQFFRVVGVGADRALKQLEDILGEEGSIVSAAAQLMVLSGDTRPAGGAAGEDQPLAPVAVHPFGLLMGTRTHIQRQHEFRCIIGGMKPAGGACRRAGKGEALTFGAAPPVGLLVRGCGLVHFQVEVETAGVVMDAAGKAEPDRRIAGLDHSPAFLATHPQRLSGHLLSPLASNCRLTRHLMIFSAP